MKQKIILSMLALLMPMGLFAADEVTIGSVTYDNSGGTGRVVSCSTDVTEAITIESSVTINGTTYPVTQIKYSAFKNCSSLPSVTLPESITTIGFSAFQNCSALTSIYLPEGITSIENYVFEGCSSLSSITLPTGVTSIGKSAFRECSSLTSITLPGGITSIENSVFNNCFSLSSITLPDGITSIGDFAFHGCSALSSITLPRGITSIGKYAFTGCTALTSINLPEGITSIGDNAFLNCYLVSVIIPSSTTYIGNSAFYDTYNTLREIYLLPDIAPTLISDTATDAEKKYVFSSSVSSVTHGTAKIYVKASSLDAYKTAFGTELAGYITDKIPYASTLTYSTFSREFDVDFSDCAGAKVMTVTGNDAATKTLTYNTLADGYVPAGEGVLVVNTENASDLWYRIGERSGVSVGTNLLKGVTEATTIHPTEGGYTNYVLKSGVFRTFTNAGLLSAHKAYLSLPTSAASQYAIDLEGTTGISSVIQQKEKQSVYNLNGQRVSQPTKGLYIINGKKVVIK